MQHQVFSIWDYMSIACLPCWRGVTICGPAALGRDKGGE